MRLNDKVTFIIHTENAGLIMANIEKIFYNAYNQLAQVPVINMQKTNFTLLNVGGIYCELVSKFEKTLASNG